MSGAPPRLPVRALRVAAEMLLELWNGLVRTVARRERPVRVRPHGQAHDLEVLGRREVERPSDISDHLVRLYSEAAALSPSLIVELGTRTGESTRALVRAARRNGAALVSVDLKPVGDLFDYDEWHFVQAEDIDFAGSFPAWCRERGLEPTVDFLFVDTSHEHDHTRAEIDAWFTHLADRCKVAFHDTHLTCLYRRRDGTAGRAWDNDRGVVRCLEEMLGLAVDERMPFAVLRKEWLVRHDPLCNGLTVLERVPEGSEAARGDVP